MKASGPFVPDWARPEDDAALRRLLRETPMDGRIRISLEREPGFFRAAEIEGGIHHCAVARDPSNGVPIAMCSRLVRRMWVNGERRPAGYLTQLRIAPEWRRFGRSMTKLGFEWLEGTRGGDEADCDFTSIIEDNAPARRLLTAGLPGLPVYREIGRIRTLLMPVRQKVRRTERTVDSGSEKQRDEIVACLGRFARRHQLASDWTAEDLAGSGLAMGDFLVVVAGGRVRGCAALWDQRSLKQAVVRGYAPTLARMRRVWNLFGAGLPVPGTALPMAFLSHLAVDGDDPDIFQALVSAALDHAGRTAGLRWLLLGLAEGHPLLPVARGFRPREYGSVLYAVHPPGCRLVFDERIPHIEIAIL
jgi:hypothetical protein